MFLAGCIHEILVVLSDSFQPSPMTNISLSHIEGLESLTNFLHIQNKISYLIDNTVNNTVLLNNGYHTFNY